MKDPTKNEEDGKGKLLTGEEYDEAVENHIKTFDIYSQTGEELFKSHRYGEAVRCYKKAFELYNNEGNDSFEKKDYEKALEYYKKAVECYNRISVFLEGRETDKTLRCFKGALDEIIEIGRLSEKGKYEEALKYSRTLDRMKKYRDLLEKGEYEKALESYKDVFHLYLKKIRDHSENKEYDKMAESYEDMMRVDDVCDSALKKKDIFKESEKYIGTPENNNIQGVYKKHAEVFIEKGKTLHDLGKYEEALDAYEKVIEIRDKYFLPQDANVWREKGRVFNALHRFEEAQIAYEKATAANANDAEAWHELGNIESRLGKFEEAQIAYEKATAANANDAEAWHELGNIRCSLGKFEEAQIAYEKAVDAYEKAVNAYKKSIKTHERENNKDESFFDRVYAVLFKFYRCEEIVNNSKGIKRKPMKVKICKSMLETYKNTIEDKRKKAIDYLGRGEFQDARKCVKELAKICPPYVELLCKNGEALYNLEEYGEALESYEKAIKIDPSNIGAVKGRVKTQYRLEGSRKHFEEQLEGALEAVRMNPHDEEAWKLKGNVYYMLGEYEKALEAYEKSIEIRRTYLDAWHNKGRMLDMLKKYEEAREAFEEAKKINKKDRVVLRRLACVLANVGEGEDALREIEEAIKINRFDPFTVYLKGVILYNLKKFEKALKAIDKALEIRPIDIDSLKVKGIILEKLGRYEQAKRTYERAIQLDRRNASLYAKLGNVYFANGDLENASKNAEEALRIDEKDINALHLKCLIGISRKEYEDAIKSIEKAHSSKLEDPAIFLCSAYARYIKIESSLPMEKKEKNEESSNENEKKKSENEKYKEELFGIISELEKASKLSKKMKENEIRACILYFLGYFYYKSKDIFAAKEKLAECIELKSNVKPRAQELLGVIWNQQIRPTVWNWWWSSPLHTMKKRATFAVITFLIGVLTLHTLFPQVIPFLVKSACVHATSIYSFVYFLVKSVCESIYPPLGWLCELIDSCMPRCLLGDQWGQPDRFAFGLVIASLILLLLFPNIERIKAKDVEVQLHSPPSIELFISPIAMEVALGEVGSRENLL